MRSPLDNLGHHNSKRVEVHDVDYVRQYPLSPDDASSFSYNYRIPVYIINALYIYPVTLWVYLKYGRPLKPGNTEEASTHAHCSNSTPNDGHQPGVESNSTSFSHSGRAANGDQSHRQDQSQNIDFLGAEDSQQDKDDHHMHHMGSDRPMFATVTIGEIGRAHV